MSNCKRCGRVFVSTTSADECPYCHSARLLVADDSKVAKVAHGPLAFPEEIIWAARFACLSAMLNGQETPGSRAMVREMFACMGDILPDDLGVTIKVSNAEAQRPAVAGTLPPLVGSSESGD